MKAKDFADYLRTRNMDETEIKEQLAAVQAFEGWLSEQGEELATAGKETINRYAGQMIRDGSNTLSNFYALCRYAWWSGLRPQYVALVEVTDCDNGMEVLRDAIKKRHGAELRDRIFIEPIPPLGAGEAVRLEHTKAVNARMNELLTPGEVHAAWFQVQHGISREDWQKHDDEQRDKYSACESVEVFLERMREDRNAMLTRMRDENKLWFTQEITDDALRYLIENRHMQLGEHNGRKGIVVTKVPYMADKVARETDETLRRYYACHCPLVREAILNGETLSDDVCYCSLGHASHYLTGIGLEHLKGKVLESVVKGDARCRFIFYLPEET
ncbi:MAG: hypothetical protein JW811_07285 [Clostridiales bacterium]|nr:hypothetical protein [Clostridiales bacterium]